MWLNEHFVNDVDTDGFGADVYSLQHTGEAKVAAATEDTICGAYDKGDDVQSRCAVADACFVKLTEKEISYF